MGLVSESILDILKDVDGVDVEQGKAYCLDDEAFYLEMLQEYVNAYKGDLIKQYYSEADWKNYAVEVHALKSSSLTIGNVALSEKAKGLEFAAKDEDVDYIKANHDAVMEEYEAFITLLQS